MDRSSCFYRPWTGEPLKTGEFAGETADGVRYIARIFETPEDAAKEGGWHDTPAVIGKGAAPAPPTPPAAEAQEPEEPGAPPADELDTLRREAAALGLTVNQRWGVTKLRKLIEEARSDDDGA